MILKQIKKLHKFILLYYFIFVYILYNTLNLIIVFVFYNFILTHIVSWYIIWYIKLLIVKLK